MSHNSIGLLKANGEVDEYGDTNSGSSYELPTASASELGGIKVGSNLSIDNNGVLSGSAPYELPTASSSTLGGIKVGSNLSINNGVLSGTAPYSLPTASASTLGGVKVGNNLSISNGVLSASSGGPESYTFYSQIVEPVKSNTYYTVYSKTGAGRIRWSVTAGEGAVGTLGVYIVMDNIEYLANNSESLTSYSNASSAYYSKLLPYIVAISNDGSSASRVVPLVGSVFDMSFKTSIEIKVKHNTTASTGYYYQIAFNALVYD